MEGQPRGFPDGRANNTHPQFGSNNGPMPVPVRANGHGHAPPLNRSGALGKNNDISNFSRSPPAANAKSKPNTYRRSREHVQLIFQTRNMFHANSSGTAHALRATLVLTRTLWNRWSHASTF